MTNGNAPTNGPTLHVLAFSGDASLRPELEAAARSLGGDLDVVLRFFNDQRLALEHARTRRPDVIAVETDDPNGLRRFSEAVADLNPVPVLIAVRTGSAYTRDDPESYFIAAARAGVRDFLRRPVSSFEMRQVFERNVTPRATSFRPSGRVVSFLSNKGGVGKSTLAVNTACAVGARRPDDVLLIDASLQMGVCASMLGLEPESTLVDAASELQRLDGSLLRRLSVPHSSGCRVLAAPRDAVEAVCIDEAVVSRILALARSEFALVVVDTFPILDAIAMATLDLSDRVHVVSTLALPTVVGLRGLFTVLEQVGIPVARQRVLVNDTHPSFAGKLTATDVANHLKRDIEAIFPFDKRVLAAYDIGRPISAAGTRWLGFGRAIHRFAASLDEWLATSPSDSARSVPSGARLPIAGASLDAAGEDHRGHGALHEAAP